MKKILLTLLCVFSLTFAYTQIDTFKTEALKHKVFDLEDRFGN